MECDVTRLVYHHVQFRDYRNDRSNHPVTFGSERTVDEFFSDESTWSRYAWSAVVELRTEVRVQVPTDEGADEIFAVHVKVHEKFKVFRGPMETMESIVERAPKSHIVHAWRNAWRELGYDRVVWNRVTYQFAKPSARVYRPQDATPAEQIQDYCG